MTVKQTFEILGLKMRVFRVMCERFAKIELHTFVYKVLKFFVFSLLFT